MRKNTIRRLLFLLLAVVFSVALMFAFIELPVWLDALLQDRVGFPGMDQGAGEEARYLTNLWIDAMYLRWIGYISLALIILFIFLGFITRKSGWAWAGALTIFLPVFGQFAYSMFFLSGLGVLRAAWFPFMDISWNMLDLGNVIYVPYWVLLWFFRQFGWYAHDFIAWLLMASGAFLFVWGVMEWLYSRFGSKGVAISSIYKISRHPQYLGWIIWSYGFMLFSMYLNDMKKSWGVSTSLPWLLMTMIIIAICLLEELKMNEKYGDDYNAYRQKTPFLFPLPHWLKELIRIPARMIIRKKMPENRMDILKITGMYTLMLVLISLLWVDFPKQNIPQTAQVPTSMFPSDSILQEINKPGQSRRDFHGHIGRIKDQAKNAKSILEELINNPQPEIREFSIYALGDLGATEATIPIIERINDENGRVRNAAIQTLGKLRATEAAPALVEALQDPAFDGYRHSLYHALVETGARQAIPLLIEGLSKPPWYQQNAAINALYEIDPDTCFPYLVMALGSTEYQVRRNAVIQLLRDKRPEAIKPLQSITRDPDFETRFYARQAIKMIEAEMKQ